MPESIGIPPVLSVLERRPVQSLLVAVAVALALTEMYDGTVQRFWTTHPMTAALVGGLVIVALTVGVIERELRAREAQRWARVAETAIRELSTAGFAALSDLADFVGFDADDEDSLERELWTTVADDDKVQEFARRVYDNTERLGGVIAQWSPVMLGNSELAEALNHFARMRDDLIGVSRAIMNSARILGWRHEAVGSFNNFCARFQAFDRYRRQVLREARLEDI